MVNQNKIVQYRKKIGMSQEELAQKIGLSRPTLIKIEKGEREWKESEKNKIQEVFEMEKKQDRVDIPQKNIEKFKQVLLYITKQIGAQPNVGMTVIYKLLYFCDFDYYEKYEKQLMGLTYFKNTHGPAPREFKQVVDSMITMGQIEQTTTKLHKYDQKKFLPLQEPDLSLLNGQELDMIDDVIDRYGDKTANVLSHLSHLDTPWKAAKVGEDLKYEHAFYRPDRFSVREYEEL